jgi:hypothetical protein
MGGQWGEECTASHTHTSGNRRTDHAQDTAQLDKRRSVSLLHTLRRIQFMFLHPLTMSASCRTTSSKGVLIFISHANHSRVAGILTMPNNPQLDNTMSVSSTH